MPMPSPARPKIYIEFHRCFIAQSLFGVNRRFGQGPAHALIRHLNPGLLCNPVYDDGIEIIAAQSSIAPRRQYLKHATLKIQDRNIESATAQIVHRDMSASGSV